MEDLTAKLSVTTEELTTLTRKLQASSEEKGKIVEEHELALAERKEQYAQLQRDYEECKNELGELTASLTACQASLEKEQGLAREAQQAVIDNTALFEQQLQVTPTLALIMPPPRSILYISSNLASGQLSLSFQTGTADCSFVGQKRS